jgi:hypothetical protein
LSPSWLSVLADFVSAIENYFPIRSKVEVASLVSGKTMIVVVGNYYLPEGAAAHTGDPNY